MALHEWCRSDDDRALHDHKSWSVSFVLRGGFYEITSHAWEPLKCKWYGAGSIIFRSATKPHRIELSDWWPYDGNGKPQQGTLALWLRGREWRTWGFWCGPDRWVPWQKYIGEEDYKQPGSTSTVGRGCG